MCILDYTRLNLTHLFSLCANSIGFLDIPLKSWFILFLAFIVFIITPLAFIVYLMLLTKKATARRGKKDKHDIISRVEVIIEPIVTDGKQRDEVLWGPPRFIMQEDIDNCSSDIVAYIKQHINISDLRKGLDDTSEHNAHVTSIIKDYLKYNEANYMIEWTPGMVAHVLPSAIAKLVTQI